MSKPTYKEFRKAMGSQEFDFDAKPELNKEEAAKLRDTGIDIAVTAANKKNSEWSEKAYAYLRDHFLLNHNGAFMGEDFRSYCALMDFPLPDNQKAFGGVLKRAASGKDPLIKKVGVQATRAKKSHRANAAVWIQIKPSDRK